MATAITIAGRPYAPKAGAPARPAIVMESSPAAGWQGTKTREKRYLHKIGNTTVSRRLPSVSIRTFS